MAVAAAVVEHDGEALVATEGMEREARERRVQAYGPSSSSPIVARKWLTPSIPGLKFGKKDAMTSFKIFYFILLITPTIQKKNST